MYNYPTGETYYDKIRGEDMNWTQLFLDFIGGFGLFMFGMEYMGDGLEKAAGSRLKNILGALTRNRVLAVLVGAGVTALIQSSSATTVMVVGFVNVGLLTLKQAVGVIMGANVGTTITSWIVALGEWTAFLKPSVLAPIFIVIGIILIMFVHKAQINSVGQILFGFGALFLGLEMMSDAAKPLSTLEQVRNLFLVLGSNPFLGILTGAVVTAIIQSSSASVGILQALALAGLVPWGSAIYIILGQNIGTCVTTLLSSIGATVNAKRAAMIHFLFNLIGSVFFAVIAILFFKVWVPEAQDILITVTQISVVHTAFNILSTILLFPFAGVLVTMAEKIIKGPIKEQKAGDYFLDERLFGTPHVAVQVATEEALKMGEIACWNVQIALETLFKYDEDRIKGIIERENEINNIQQKINDYLIKLSNLSIAESDQLIVSDLFHMVSDIERVGDHAENIAEMAESMKKDKLKFSDAAKKELEQITDKTLACFAKALAAYKQESKELALEAMPLEIEVDKLEQKFRSTHMKRLAKKECDPVSGAVYLDLISNIERISDHSRDIAVRFLKEMGEKGELPLIEVEEDMAKAI